MHILLASIYSLLFCIFSNAEIPRHSNASSSKSVSQVSTHWCCHCRVIGNSLPRASPRHLAFPSNQEDEDRIMTGDDGASVCAFATTKYWDRIEQITQMHKCTKFKKNQILRKKFKFFLDLCICALE